MKPHVLGVRHNDKDTSFPIVMSYIDQIVQRGQRIAFECSLLSIDEIDNNKDSTYGEYRFAHKLTTMLRNKGAMPIPVEDKRIHRMRSSIRTFYMFEGDSATFQDKRMQRLGVWSSLRLLGLAQYAQADYLIIGTIHALHLHTLGYKQVTMFSSGFVPEPKPNLWPLESTIEANAARKYGKAFWNDA